MSVFRRLAGAGWAALLAISSGACTGRAPAAKPWPIMAKEVVVPVPETGGAPLAGAVVRCSLDGTSCVDVAEDSLVAPGALLRTGRGARLVLDLSDGTKLRVSEGTELALRNGSPRVAELRKGGVVLERTPPDAEREPAAMSPSALFELDLAGLRATPVPAFPVRLTARASGNEADLMVGRGKVGVGAPGATALDLRNGESAHLERGKEPERRRALERSARRGAQHDRGRVIGGLHATASLAASAR